MWKGIRGWWEEGLEGLPRVWKWRVQAVVAASREGRSSSRQRRGRPGRRPRRRAANLRASTKQTLLLREHEEIMGESETLDGNPTVERGPTN
jgi:hypothetical protein